MNNLPLYGRAFELSVTLPPDASGNQEVITLASDSFDVSPRVTFDIVTPAFQTYWSADICVYNLDQNVVEKITQGVVTAPSSSQPSQATVTQGMIVTLSAGYQSGNYGVIWQGPVFQAMYERENAVDLKLTLYCLISFYEVNRQFVKDTIAAGFTQEQQLQRIIQLTTSQGTLNPATIESFKVSPNISQQKLPRGKVVFGSPGKYFTEIAEGNNMQWWLTHKGLNFGNPAEDVTQAGTPKIVFSPPTLPGLNTTGPQLFNSTANGIIVGTPQQTQQGVSFRALLDPRVVVEKPLLTVKIDNSQLRLQKRQLNQYIGVLDQDGIYVVGGARFRGDTRGNDWYVDVDGYTVINNALAFFAATEGATATNPVTQPDLNR